MQGDHIRSSDDHSAVDANRRFELIFDRFHGDVCRYCVRRLGRSDGEDAAAEVLAVAWRRLDQIPAGDATRAWLLGVAYRVVGNHYRGRARKGRLVARLQSARITDDAASSSGIGEDEVAVLAALASLRPLDRELLCMVAWDGLSRSEIAAVLAIGENAVDQRLFRARKRLRGRLERPDRAVEGMEA